MKRKRAEEILADSFRELAETKPVDKITIREITDNCDYSPATFYRHFKDKYDLITWDYIRGHMEIMKQIEDPSYQWKQTLYEGAVYFYSRKEYLSNLLLHTSGMDSFIRNMTDIHCDSLRRCVIRSSGNDRLSQETEMYIRFYCHGTVGLTADWLLGRYTATPEEMAAIYENSLPVPLKPYLENE